MFYNLRTTTVSSGASVADARLAAESVVMPLESRIEHLELACAGLWTLLKQKHGYSDDDLIAAIQEVDMLDGTLDGKIGRASQNCPHCQRKLLTRDSPKCSWCGGSLAHRPL